MSLKTSSKRIYSPVRYRNLKPETMKGLIYFADILQDIQHDKSTRPTHETIDSLCNQGLIEQVDNCFEPSAIGLLVIAESKREIKLTSSKLRSLRGVA